MISFGRLFNPSAVVVLATQVVLSLNGEGLRVAFEVQRSLTSEPDTARCSIYNLSPERRATLHTLFGETGRSPLQIRAGYDGVVADLFRGDVRKMRSGRRSGPDRLTEAWADDGGDALADVNVTVSTATSDARTLIEIALKAFALGGHPVPTVPPQPIVKHPSVDATLATVRPEAATATYAAVHVGKASQLLDEAARLLEARWWIRDGQLFMGRRRQPTDSLAIVLPRTHWLGEPDDDGLGLVRLSVLMDPNITPGRLVVVEKQQYRCEAATYRGDTRAGPWSVSMVLRRSA